MNLTFISYQNLEETVVTEVEECLEISEPYVHFLPIIAEALAKESGVSKSVNLTFISYH